MTALEPRLVAVTGVMSGEVFPLSGPELSLGREPSNVLCFPDPALSRRQCVFTVEEGAWMLTNLSTSNGTFVNGLQVATHRLSEGDRIAVGGSILLFVETARAAATAAPDEPGAGPDDRLAPAVTKYLETPIGPDRLSRTEQGLRALLRLSAVVHSTQSEDALYAELLKLLTGMLPIRTAAIVMRNQDGVLETVQNDASSTTPARDLDVAMVEQVMASRGGMLGRRDGSTRPGVPTLIVPLVLGNRAAGVIYLEAAGAAFDNEDLQLLMAVATLSAIAIENVRRVASLERETERLKLDAPEPKLVGGSPPILALNETIRRVSRAQTTVLLTGETGTGKEIAARTIHMNSPRATRPFVAVNCAALAENLLESELFGHERGAFSGAVQQKKGRIELAESGTLFLDEIGDLPLAMQSKLLRVLQEREFERLGGTRTLKVDIRLISATNRDLAAEVRAGRFRDDLFYRLKVVQIEMPPLRDRPADIPALARHFLDGCRGKAGRHVTGISPEAMACLRSYDWPGNVRELENTIERAAVLGSTEEILPDDLPEAIVEAHARVVRGEEGNIHSTIIEAKKTAVIAAFRATGGNYTATARMLGVHPNYLHRLIKNLGIKALLNGGE